jgi:hypothetical protein
MRSKNRVLLTITCLALAASSCQALSGLGGGTPIASGTDAPQDGKVLLEEDYSSPSGWGTGTDKDSSIEYEDETLHAIIYTKNYFVWSAPNDKKYQNIHLEVNVTNNDTDPTTAFGIICYQQETPDSFYYLAITPAGQYAIAKATVGARDVILTNDNQFGFSDLIEANAPSYRVGADCTDGTLTLYVDGQRIDGVSDSTYQEGSVALFTWSGQDVASADITFDDFVISELP